MKIGNLLPLYGNWYKVIEHDEVTGEVKLKKQEATGKALKLHSRMEAQREKAIGRLITAARRNKSSTLGS